MDEEREVWEGLEAQWPVVLQELDRLVQAARDRLASRSNIYDISDVRMLQGEIEAYRKLAVLPKRKLEEMSKSGRDRTRR